MKRFIAAGFFSALLLASSVCSAAEPLSDEQRLAEQRTAMMRFALLDGVWRGPATTTLRDGTRRTITQTERIGPFLDGTVRVIEGRGYDENGVVRFNAFGTISYDPSTQAFTLHSYAQSYVGDYPFLATADGYEWTFPAGPVRIRYTAKIADGNFREIGERILPGAPTVTIFEMNLRRIADATWPAGGAVAPR